MKKNEYRKNLRIIFWLVILFLGAITWMIYIIYGDTAPLFIAVTYNILPFIFVIGFLYYFKRTDMIRANILFNKNEFESILIVITFFFLYIIASNKLTDIQTFLSGLTWRMLLPIFGEELFFRIFIIGTLLYNVPLSRASSIKVYFNKEDSLKIIKSLILSSFLFTLWHPKDFGLGSIVHFIMSFFFYGLPFIATNKKIYPSLMIHYYNNIIVPL